MTITAPETRHPLLAAAAVSRSAFETASDRDPVFLSTAEKREAVVELFRLEQQLRATRLQVMAVADDVALDAGTHDVGVWTAHTTLSDRSRAHADLRLAEALEQRWTLLGASARAGAVNMDQTAVISRCLDELPRDLDPELLLQAEQHLVGLASDHPPRELRILGRHVLEVVAPEVAEAAEAAALERETHHACEATRLNLQRTGDGTTRISGRVPDAVAARLRGHLDAFTSPRRPGGGVVPFDEGSAEQRRGQAFCALLESMDPRRTPLHGGDATTLIVTVPLATLQGGLEAAEIVGEGPLSPSEARRLACTAAIIPAVLGGRSEILDLGRARRLYSAPQRKAFAVRDKRCRAEGCGVPASWCEAHHLTPWRRGGRTDIDNGVLLCAWHHHRVHDARYRCERLPGGDLRFNRRT